MITLENWSKQVAEQLHFAEKVTLFTREKSSQEWRLSKHYNDAIQEYVQNNWVEPIFVEPGDSSPV